MSVVRTLSWPSHSASVAWSTPARRSWTAQLWRRTCGASFLPRRVGQAWAAVAQYLARRRSTASRLSGPPRLAGKRGSGRSGVLLLHPALGAATVAGPNALDPAL